MDESPIQRIGSSVSQTWIRIPIKAIAVYVALYFELSVEVTVVFLLAIFLSEIYEYIAQKYVNNNPEHKLAVALILGQSNIVLSLVLLVFTGFIRTDVVLILFPVIISVSINSGLLGGVMSGLISAFFYVVVTRPELTTFEPMFRAVMFAIVGLLSGILAEANLQNQFQNINSHARFGKSGEATNLKRDFLSIASHYLRTPLTALKGHFEQLQKNEDPAELEKVITEMGSSIARVELVNETILKVISFEADNTELHLVDASINDLVRELIDSFSILAAKRGVELVYSAPKEEVVMHIDPAKIRTVFTNLIDNAIIFSPDHTSVEVQIYTDGAQVVFTVTDHGKGIKQAELALLFEPFLKLDVLNMTSEGMGLGLYFTKRIIELHGGSISVKSKVSEGTTFMVMLPKETSQTFLEEIG